MTFLEGLSNVFKFLGLVDGYESGDCSDAEFSSDEQVRSDDEVVEVDTTSKKIYNILVIGATGVGKSTLINSFHNLRKYETYDEILSKNNPDVVIKGQFDYFMNDGEQNLTPHKISYKPNVKLSEKKSQQGPRNNRIQDDITQESLSYLFEMDDCVYRIIDTPGVMDVRGVSSDKENFEALMQHISQYHSLEAIVIVFSNDSARLSAAFRYSIQELLLHLPRDACKNIIFAFTHTIATNYSPGDCLQVLRSELKNVYDKNGVQIPCQKSNIFCFDNVWFRQLFVVKEGLETNESSERMSDCFDKNKSEMFNLLDKASKNISHKTTDTVCLNNVRNMIYLLYRPLATVAKTVQQNIHKLENAKNNPFLDNNGAISVENVVTRMVETDYPTTVCTNCPDYIQVGGMKKPKYKRCHERCSLTGVQVESIPNPILKGCAAMGGGSDPSCARCGCHWEKHMHVRYFMEETVEVQKQHVKNTSEGATFIENMKNQNQGELDFIKQCCSEFCVYLKYNSINHTNDAYVDYLKFLCEEEHRSNPNSTLEKEIRQMAEEYKQQAAIIEKHIREGTQKPKTTEEINDLLDQLMELPVAGPILRQVKEFELNRLSKE